MKSSLCYLIKWCVCILTTFSAMRLPRTGAKFEDWARQASPSSYKQSVSLVFKRQMLLYRFVWNSPCVRDTGVSDEGNGNRFWRQIWDWCLAVLSGWASLVAELVKNPSVMQETQVWYLGWEDLLEKRQETHSSLLACMCMRLHLHHYMLLISELATFLLTAV